MRSGFGLADHAHQYCKLLFDVSLCFKEDPKRVKELMSNPFDYSMLGYNSPGKDTQRKAISLMALQELGFGALTALNSSGQPSGGFNNELNADYLRLYLQRCVYSFRRYYLDQQLRGMCPLRRFESEHLRPACVLTFRLD